MANCVCEVALLEKPLPMAGWRSELNGAGAVAEFRGVVRPLENGAGISGIDYEAHRPMAEHQLRVIAQQAIALFNLFFVRIEHRIGYVPAGEPSLYLCVASAHRAAAFDASRWIVDELKKRVPIWKHPRTAAPVTGVVDPGPRSTIAATTR